MNYAASRWIAFVALLPRLVFAPPLVPSRPPRPVSRPSRPLQPGDWNNPRGRRKIGRTLSARLVTMASSSTSVVELEPVQLAVLSSKANSSANPIESPPAGQPLGTADDHVHDLPRPGTSTSVVQRWNYPRGNAAKVAACFFSFVVMGANDAAYGVSSRLPGR